MGGFSRGFEQGENVAKNPFAVLLDSIGEGIARRRAEDKKRADEENALRQEIIKLGVKDTYDKALQKEKILSEGLIKGDIEETTDIGEGTFEGTPFGAVGKRYKRGINSESELKSTELKLKKKQLEELESYGGTGNIKKETNDLYNKLDIPEDEREDYQVKVDTESIRGIKTQKLGLERKQRLPASELADIGRIRDGNKILNDIKVTLENFGLQMGPGFSTRPGAIADLLAQSKGANFSALKAKIGRAFQKYRKAVTGVAAGYPELNMLAPNYIKATDTNDVLIQKALDILKEGQDNEEILLDTFSKGGYAVSQLRKKSNKNMSENKKTITLPSGKKSSAQDQNENLVSQYMQKYPNRSREEVINAMKKQGLL
jgi:hypothetical protein